MAELIDWVMDIRNSKILALLIFFTTFVGIIIYVYGSKKRGQRMETYRDIPFLDEDSERLPHKSVNNDSSRNSGK